MIRIKGKAVSSGIALGRALLFSSRIETIRRESIQDADIEKEIWRFNNGVRKTQAQLKKIFRNLHRIMGKDAALIIETQYLLLADSKLLEDIRGFIRSQLVRSEWAIKEIENRYRDYFLSIPDLAFQAKSNDIADVLNRIIGNLRKRKRSPTETEAENVVLIADELSPSEAAKLMSSAKILGLVLNRGGETSHTVILARTLGIPAITETGNATEIIGNGDLVVVDSVSGEVVVNPSRTFLAEVQIKREKFGRYQEQLKTLSQLPELTRDGHAFHLYANIELPSESDIILSYGAKGVGLFRTEFLFLDSRTNMSEEGQFLIYKNIAQKLFPHPLVIRTFDLGRDKSNTASHLPMEENPSLGLMAVRFFLKNRSAFKVQIKAIQRANISGNIRILFPMITEIEEIHAIKEIMGETRNELLEEGRCPKFDVPLGVMIEIPAMIALIPHLRHEVDFFSVGTNDLTQYLLAVDRNNTQMAYLFNHFHPMVMKTLQLIKESTARIGKEVTVCGEIAGRCIPALMLLGMGYSHFSMTPLAIAEIKRAFTNIHYGHLRHIVQGLYRFSSKSEIEEYLTEALLKKYPGLFIKHPAF